MKALIAPNGQIVQVAAQAFAVAPPLSWVDVPDGTTERDRWDGTKVVKEVPRVPPVTERLAETDIALVRVIEDIAAVLTPTQLSRLDPVARNRINERRALRGLGPL